MTSLIISTVIVSTVKLLFFPFPVLFFRSKSLSLAHPQVGDIKTLPAPHSAVTHQNSRTQHMVVLGAPCYYGKGIQSKVTKVNKCTGRSLGEIRQKLPRVLGITQYVLHSLAVSYDNTCGMLSIRKTCFSLGVQDFYWGLVRQAISAQCVSNSRLPEGKQCLIIYRKFYTSERNYLLVKFPAHSQRPILQAGLSKDSNLRPSVLALFCTGKYPHITFTSYFYLRKMESGKKQRV